MIRCGNYTRYGTLQSQIHFFTVSKDINECAQNSSVCHDSNMTCVNTYGSYKCVRPPSSFDACAGAGCLCDNGFRLSSNDNHESQTCQDVDECAETPAICGQLGKCLNLMGTYSCLCSPGYTFSNGTCTDINECVDFNFIEECRSINATCENLDASFRCVCSKGYRAAGPPKGAFSVGGRSFASCVDINECAEDRALCGGVSQSTCCNTPGSFKCTCHAGYVWSEASSTCVDFDECQDHGTPYCNEYGTCVNTVGSFTCNCSNGWERSVTGLCVGKWSSLTIQQPRTLENR